MICACLTGSPFRKVKAASSTFAEHHGVQLFAPPNHHGSNFKGSMTRSITVARSQLTSSGDSSASLPPSRLTRSARIAPVSAANRSAAGLSRRGIGSPGR